GSWATPLHLVAQRPDGPRPSWNEYPDDEAEAAGTAARIRDLIDDGVPASGIAVLFRTNGQSQAFETALAEAGIGFQLRGTERFFNRPEVKQAVVQLRTAARAAEASDEPTRLVRDILSSLGYSDRAPRSTGAVRERWESLAALVSLADRMAEEAAARGEQLLLPDLAAELERRTAQQDAPVMNGVTLASLHSAKGLEWDAVFLAGLSEGLVPIGFAETADEIDEERRLLYVGITRAREHLVLSWTLSRTPGGRPTRKPSRFLDGLRETPPPRARGPR
ncbi:3'-5' exonuclease, partial [Kocuria oceani]